VFFELLSFDFTLALEQTFELVDSSFHLSEHLKELMSYSAWSDIRVSI